MTISKVIPSRLSLGNQRPALRLRVRPSGILFHLEESPDQRQDRHDEGNEIQEDRQDTTEEPWRRRRSRGGTWAGALGVSAAGEGERASMCTTMAMAACGVCDKLTACGSLWAKPPAWCTR